MVLLDLFSKRQQRLGGELPDVYTYDAIPQPLRVQIVQIMWDIIGSRDEYVQGRQGYGYRGIFEAYRSIVQALRRELGVFRLPGADGGAENFYNEISAFLVGVQEVEYFLDAVELICRVVEENSNNFYYRGDQRQREKAKAAIEELNLRFKEHGVGYQYDDEIIRVDSALLHAEAVKPALALLRDAKFKGAEEEFLSAFSHYRKGNYKEALNDALKSLESTMKTICDKRRWGYAKNDTASKLLAVCFDNGLVPPFWVSHFSALRATLEAGVPTGRNKLSGHGQGQAPQIVPDFVASYVLHMTASAILFLLQSEKLFLRGGSNNHQRARRWLLRRDVATAAWHLLRDAWIPAFAGLRVARGDDVEFGFRGACEGQRRFRARRQLPPGDAREGAGGEHQSGVKNRGCGAYRPTCLVRSPAGAAVHPPPPLSTPCFTPRDEAAA